MKPAPSFRQPIIPTFGSIKGGKMDGWTYSFLRLVMPRGRPALMVLATPPNWPFPVPVCQLKASDFHRLEAAERGPEWIDTRKLIAAFAAEKKT